MFSQFNRLKELLLHEQSRKWLWVGLSALLVGAFLVLSAEVREFSQGQSEWIGRADEWFLRTLISLRNPKLNAVAVDITGLGSLTVLTLFIFAVTIYFLISKKSERVSHLIGHMILAGLGAMLFTNLLKSYFERSRPALIDRLVNVEGFSYPSGHSLGSAAVYFTIAVICSQFIHGKRKRTLCIALFMLLIIAIGVSRMYLGVHYFSDVTAGICLGVAWASLLTSLLMFIGERFES